MQQVKIEIISAETAEARLASPRDAVSRHVIGPDFRDEEHAVALAGNDAADQFLRAAAAIHLRRVDQRHSERKTGTQRFFLGRFRTSLLRKICRALAERRDNGSIAELHRRNRSASRCVR